MKCIAITHIAFEDLGSFAAPIRARGYDIEYRHAGAAPLTAQEWLETDLVVVLGGPIGVGDTADYPWLRRELSGLRARLECGKPTLGICLGAQLMAAALGGDVVRRRDTTGFPAVEIGWGPLRLADDPGVLASLRDVAVLHWHGDNIVLPTGIDSLAATAWTPVQAFAIGTHALGLQFHAEFQPQALEQWLSGHAIELRQAGIPLDVLRIETVQYGKQLVEAGREVVANWLGKLPTGA